MLEVGASVSANKYKHIANFVCDVQYFEYQKMRRKQKLPPMLLFTLDSELFDWFGWGDWLYVFASLLSFVQSFFIFLPIDDDTNFGFNLLGKKLAALYIITDPLTFCVLIYSQFYIFNRFPCVFCWIHPLFARIGRRFQRVQLSKARSSRCHQVLFVAKCPRCLFSISFVFFVFLA